MVNPAGRVKVWPFSLIWWNPVGGPAGGVGGAGGFWPVIVVGARNSSGSRSRERDTADTSADQGPRFSIGGRGAWSNGDRRRKKTQAFSPGYVVAVLQT